MMNSSIFLLGILPLVVAVFDRSSCDVEKACFIPTDANCYQGCSGMGFSYAFTDDTYQFMKIELFGNSETQSGVYFAVGFSVDSMMGAESVIECSSLGKDGELSLKFSYNAQHFFANGEPSNVRIKNQDSYKNHFGQPVVKYENGQIYCSAVVDVRGANDTEVFQFDKQNPYYWLLMANGPTNSSGLLHHIHDVTTAFPINLMDVHWPFDPNGCGVTKGCFIPNPEDCGNKQTEMLVSYFIKDNETLQLEIVGPAQAATDGYVAVGFSLDNKMGNESVIECSSLGNTNNLSTKFSYNDEAPKNVRITNETTLRGNLIQADQAYYQDGKYYCRATVKVTGDASHLEIFHYDPNQKYYLLLAQGPANDDGLLHHTTTCRPKEAVYLAQPQPDFDSSTCGKEKSCFLPTECYMGCRGMGFSFKLTDSSHMEIEMVAEIGELGNYAAVGFSTDAEMGSESVIECSSINGSQYSLKFSYNQDYNVGNVRIDGEEALRNKIITNPVVKFVDGRLYCSGLIDISGSNEDAKRQIFRYDPNRNYYFLMASGTTSDSGLNKHVDHVVSGLPYDLTSGQQVSPTDPFFDCSSCGKTKGCFFPDDPDLLSCNDFGVSWRYISDSQMEMELTKKGTDGYVAVGFSSDNMMGDDNVIEFSQLTNHSWSWKFSYNNDKPRNVRIPNEAPLETTYFTQTSFNISDGLIYARATVNVGGLNGQPQVFRYNSSRDYYLLMARGSKVKVNATQLLGHEQAEASPLMFNLTSMKAVSVDPTPAPPNENFDCSQCGGSKGCFFPRGQNDCTGMGVAYQMQLDGTLLVELMKPEDSGYIAVGFNSKAQTMGPANIIECSELTGSSLSMKFSYNDGGHHNLRIQDESTIEPVYFKSAQYKTINGQMYCSAYVNVSGWSGSDQVFTYDPSQTYYLLVAKGATSAIGLTKHSDFQPSSQAVDLKSTEPVNGKSDTTQRRLIHAHAIMMILAWICFVPTALLFARFFRNSWPLVKPGGLLIWFHVHRTANLLGIVLMIASFICIMCAKNWNWTGPGSNSGKWPSVHTMTGLFALIFAWMQPFVSFMRCSPNTPNRPYFNWAHRLIGITAYILATTALSVAAFHFKSHWANPTIALILVLIPITMIAVFVFFFPILEHFEKKSELSQHDMYEMIRQSIILVAVGVLVGDAIALSIMVKT